MITSPIKFVYYKGDGVTTDFAYAYNGTVGFDTKVETDVKSAVKTPDGTKIYDPNFAVLKDTYGNLTGEIRFAEAPADGSVIFIYRATPQTQETSYETSSGFNAQAVEKSLDKLTKEIQDTTSHAMTKTLQLDIFQEEPWFLEFLNEETQGRYLYLDFAAKAVRAGLKFEFTENNRFRVTKDGHVWKYIPESDQIEEIRQITLENPHRYVYQYRIGTQWYSVGEDAFQMATEALEKANQAITTSNSALDTANQAKTDAENAVETSNQALGVANKANETAESANTKSDNAVESANKAVETSNQANATAMQAQDIAATANATSDEAKKTADSVLGVAQNAVDTANKANQAAESASALVAGAVATAADAKATAEAISDTAQNALNVANQAKTTAEDAASQVATATKKADDAKAAADSVVGTAQNALNVANEAKQSAENAISGLDRKQDKGDYATKTELNTKQDKGDYATNQSVKDAIVAERSISDGKYLTIADSKSFALKTALESTNKMVEQHTQEISDVMGDISALEHDKQDKLTAGDGITIEDNVISAENLDLSKYATTELLTERADGQWVANELLLAENGTITGANVTYDLSSYLPNDDYSYELLVCAVAVTGAASGNMANVAVNSDLVGTMYVTGTQTRASAATRSIGSCIVPIKERKLVQLQGILGTNTGNYSIRLKGYRRIGTNK